MAARSSPWKQEKGHRGAHAGSSGTSSDGTGARHRVIVQLLDATAGDRTGVIVARGPSIVSKAALVFDDSVDQVAEQSAKHAQLITIGTIPRETA
jgi:hypothetical protein